MSLIIKGWLRFVVASKLLFILASEALLRWRIYVVLCHYNEVLRRNEEDLIYIEDERRVV